MRFPPVPQTRQRRDRQILSGCIVVRSVRFPESPVLRRCGHNTPFVTPSPRSDGDLLELEQAFEIRQPQHVADIFRGVEEFDPLDQFPQRHQHTQHAAGD